MNEWTNGVIGHNSALYHHTGLQKTWPNEWLFGWNTPNVCWIVQPVDLLHCADIAPTYHRHFQHHTKLISNVITILIVIQSSKKFL